MSHVINGETVYTQEELQTEVVATRHNQHEKTVGQIATITLDVLRDKVINESLNEEQALDVYNSIANKVGSSNWDTIESIVQLWTVTVTYNYQTVLEVTDIKADSEDDAIAEVRDNLSIVNPNLTFSVEYDGEAGSANDSYDMEYDEDDIFSDLEFSAEEQD